MIGTPYYRIYRPNKSGNNEYIRDIRYCSDRLDLVRYYKILENEFIKLLDYIELSDKNLSTFSINNYKLLTNICIEVENNLKGIILSNNYETNKKDLSMMDYSNLDKYLKLKEYKVELNIFYFQKELKPFIRGKDNQLKWYKAYNKLKHNRSKNIEFATIENIINALAGLYILLYAQFYLLSDCASDKCNTYFQVQYGVYNSFNTSSIFKVVKQPKWLENEYYNFNWEDIKNNDCPFQKLNIENNTLSLKK